MKKENKVIKAWAIIEEGKIWGSGKELCIFRTKREAIEEARIWNRIWFKMEVKKVEIKIK